MKYTLQNTKVRSKQFESCQLCPIFKIKTYCNIIFNTFDSCPCMNCVVKAICDAQINPQTKRGCHKFYRWFLNKFYSPTITQEEREYILNNVGLTYYSPHISSSKKNSMVPKINIAVLKPLKYMFPRFFKEIYRKDNYKYENEEYKTISYRQKTMDEVQKYNKLKQFLLDIEKIDYPSNLDIMKKLIKDLNV